MNLVSKAEISSLSVSKDVHSDDEMWHAGKEWYFTVGQSGLQVVNQVLATSNLLDVKRILDLPCGHGRVGRYLRAGFPNAEIIFCDINRSGVDFCTSTFNGKGLYSEPDLTTVDLGQDYDLIWVGSLFTHLNEKRTAKWLAYLAGVLSDRGVLIATFHGAWGIEVLKQRSSRMIKFAMLRYWLCGYGYAPYSGTPDYGLSISKASKIIDMAMKIPKIRILSYTERGWADNHDVLSISRQDRLEPWN